MSDALAAIRKLYFATSKATIADDFDQAIDLLKSMASDDERERAAVFMEGLAEMRREWNVTSGPASGVPRSGGVRGRSGRSKGGGRRPR
jgi:hypothetical protein